MARLCKHLNRVNTLTPPGPCRPDRGPHATGHVADSLQTLRLVQPGQASSPDGIGPLLVEDDASIRYALADMLGDEGFDVTTVVNGRDALNALRCGAPPDVILLDLMMPVMDGWEFRVEQR